MPVHRHEEDSKDVRGLSPEGLLLAREPAEKYARATSMPGQRRRRKRHVAGVEIRRQDSAD